MKWLCLPVKVLKCVSCSWVYMSKFGVQGFNNVFGTFGEICLNAVFLGVVVLSVI